MAKSVRSGNVDFDDLFDPDIVGDGPSAANIRSGGVAVKYAALQYGTKRADVGWRAGGVDVSNLWAAKGTAVYVITGLNGRDIFVSEQANTNQGSVQASATVSIGSDGQWQFFGGTNKGPAAIPAPSSGTWLPAGGAVADYQVQLDVTFSSNTGHGSYTNGAPAYADCTTSRGATVSLPNLSAANAIERDAHIQVRVRIRHKTTLAVVSDSTCDLNVATVGFA